MPTYESIEQEIITQIFHILPTLRSSVLKSKEFSPNSAVQLPHIQVLLSLTEHSSLTVTQLSRITGIVMPNITPLLDRLLSLAIISRTPSEQDRRMVFIQVTESGRAFLKTILNELSAHLLNEQYNFSPEKLVEIRDAFRVLCDSFLSPVV